MLTRNSGLDRGSNVGWNDTITITCCSLSIPLLAVFVFVEMKVAAFPFAPGHIIFERSVVASYIVNFLSLAGHLSGIFYVPLYLQVCAQILDRISQYRSNIEQQD